MGREVGARLLFYIINLLELYKNTDKDKKIIFDYVKMHIELLLVIMQVSNLYIWYYQKVKLCHKNETQPHMETFSISCASGTVPREFAVINDF